MNVDDLLRERTTLRESLRRFLAERLAATSGLAAGNAPLHLRRSAWEELGAQGWLTDRSEVELWDLVVMHEEWGRQAVALPLISYNYVAAAVEANVAGQSAVADRMLSEMKAATRIVVPTALAIASATESGGLVAIGVPGATLATDFLIQVPDGLMLVSAAGTGVHVAPLTTSSNLDMATVSVDARAVARGELIVGRVHAGRASAHALFRSRLLLAGEMMGAAGEVLDMSASYAKERVQFGRPIGSFQAIQHKLADMVVARDSARGVIHRAALTLDRVPSAARSVAIAKLSANVCSRRIAFEAHQVFAGVGYMREHKLHVYTFSQAIHERLLGSTEELRQSIHLLGDAA